MELTPQMLSWIRSVVGFEGVCKVAGRRAAAGDGLGVKYVPGNFAGRQPSSFIRRPAAVSSMSTGPISDREVVVDGAAPGVGDDLCP
jgi:hypothetical protein